MTDKKQKQGNGQPLPHQDTSLPEGAMIIDTGEERSYFVAAPGNVCRGSLLRVDQYKINGRDVQSYVILTDAPCQVVQGDTQDERKTPKIAPAGTQVHINRRHGLAQLEHALSVPYLVWVSCQSVEKKQIGVQTVWRWRIAAKALPQRRLQMSQGLALTAGIPGNTPPMLPAGNEEDIPF